MTAPGPAVAGLHRGPVAVLVIGPAGSGKSTVSRQVAVRTGAVYLDKDALGAPFVAAMLAAAGLPEGDRDSDHYRTTVLPLEYDALLRVAADNLALGRAVVLDAPFGAFVADPAYVDRVRVTAGWGDVPVLAVRVTADAETVRARLVDRGSPRDDWKLAHWVEFWTAATAVECRWSGVRHVEVLNGAGGADLTPVERAWPVG